MKKSTIKRRKRVVPALQDRVPDKSPRQTHSATSVSPGASPAVIFEQRLQQRSPVNLNPDSSVRLEIRPRELESNRQYEAIPTDFTGFGRQPSKSPDVYSQEKLQLLRFSPPFKPSPSISAVQATSSTQSSQTEQKRKRTFAVAEGSSNGENSPGSARSNKLSSISSILNPAQQSGMNHEDTPMDLSYQRGTRLQQQAQQRNQAFGTSASSKHRSRPPDYEDSGGNVKVEQKSLRKAQLEREAEQMRAILKAKERELLELDKDS